jgi:asparagine synthase (glutamine-hydrolysing)
MAATDPLRRIARRLRNRFGRKGLSPLTRAVMDEGLTYLSPAKLRRMEAALASARAVPGDFAEFGVALGGSAILIASRSEGRRFHGFDVFGMIPEPGSDKDDLKSKARYEAIRSGASRGIDGQLYYGYRSDLFAEVKDSFARHGLPVGQAGIHLHKGLFEESWPRVDVDSLAFVHIDCDWYDPVRYCLDAVAAKLSPGGVVMIDDYYDYGGCRTAVDEFLAGHPGYALEDGPNPILRRVS